MKNFLLILGFAIGMPLFSISQSATDTIQPLISKPGTPIGGAVKEKIGKDGGKIISEDGRVEVVFPKGALKKNTDISIQAVNNTMPGGTGKAYHLKPSDIEFEQPAEIIFHYLPGNDPSLMGIAMQDEGKWFGLRKFVLDTINKTIKGSIRHFSYWVNYYTASLVPAYARVKVNKELSLEIYSFQSTNDDEFPELSLVRTNVPPVWTVNSITNGNAAVGTAISTNLSAAHYKAPATVPDRNPVAVTAEIKGLNFMEGNQRFQNLKLTSNVLVYDDAYEVKVESWNDNVIANQCTFRVTDFASFVVQLEGTKAKVVDINNSLLSIPISVRCPCTFVWVNQAICLGPVHVISSLQRTSITPAQPPGRPFGNVKLWFAPMMGVLPVFNYSCRTGNGTTPNLPIPAFPAYIEFATKKEQQVVANVGDESNGFKITVKQITED